MTKSLFNLPKKYKRLKCKLPQNYQCGGKCQPARFNCKKTVKGVPKSALDWLKYVEERKTRVSAINDRQQGGRSRLEVDDLGFVKRVGQSANFNSRKGKIDGNVIPQIDLHLFLKPGDKVVTKENWYSEERSDSVANVKTKTFMPENPTWRFKYRGVPIKNIQSVTRDGKTYSVEQTGEWTAYIEDGIKNGTLDWERFNLKDKFPSLYKLYGKQSKPGKLSTEKVEGKKHDFKFKGTRLDSLSQSNLLDSIAEQEDKRLPDLLKKAKQWATNPPDYPQISRQKRKVESTRRLLRNENAIADWIRQKSDFLRSNPKKDYRVYKFPSVEKEEAILAAMMGDGGKKLKEKYPIFLQEIKNVADSIFYSRSKPGDRRDAKVSESDDYTRSNPWRDAWHDSYFGGGDDDYWNNVKTQLGDRVEQPTSVFGVKLTGDHDKDLPLVKSAYRKAAKETHPDTGGNDAAFRKVNEEWERYLKTLPANYSEPYLLYSWK